MSGAALTHRVIRFVYGLGRRGVVDWIFGALCLAGLSAAITEGPDATLARLSDDWGMYEIFALLTGQFFVLLEWPPSLIALSCLLTWCGGLAIAFAVFSPEPTVTLILLGVMVGIRTWAYSKPRSDRDQSNAFAYTMLLYVPHICVALFGGILLVNWFGLQAQHTHYELSRAAMSDLDAQRYALATGAVFYLSLPWVYRWIDRGYMTPEELAAASQEQARSNGEAATAPAVIAHPPNGEIPQAQAATTGETPDTAQPLL